MDLAGPPPIAALRHDVPRFSTPFARPSDAIRTRPATVGRERRPPNHLAPEPPINELPEPEVVDETAAGLARHSVGERVRVLEAVVGQASDALRAQRQGRRRPGHPHPLREPGVHPDARLRAGRHRRAVARRAGRPRDRSRDAAAGRGRAAQGRDRDRRARPARRRRRAGAGRGDLPAWSPPARGPPGTSPATATSPTGSRRPRRCGAARRGPRPWCRAAPTW